MLVIEWLALLLAPLGFALWHARYSEPARTRRRLRAMRRSDIGAVQEGPVKVAGALRLVPGKKLRAPLSGRTCALYDVVVVEEGRRSDAISIEERMACDFALDDGTGTALVRFGPIASGSRALRLEIVRDTRYASGTFEAATADLERLLAAYGHKTADTFPGRRLTYREGAFEPGERIVVQGYARREPDPEGAAGEGGYREPPMRLVIAPLDGVMYLSDDSEGASS